MRIEQVRLGRWRGVEVTLPWRPVMVFFGANGAGKSNILEVLTASLEGELEPHRRPDPLGEDWSSITLDLVFRLDHMVPSTPDAQMFGSLARYGRWVLPESVGDTAGPLYLPDGYAVEIPSAAGVDPTAIRAAIREEILLWAADKARQWEPVAATYELVLDEALTSTLFSIDFEDLSWVLPPLEELTDRARDALSELHRRRDLFDGAEVPLFDPVTDDDPQPELVEMLTWRYPPDQAVPIRVMDLSSDSAYEDTVRHLEDYIRLEAWIREGVASGRKFLISSRRDPSRDSWLNQAESGEGHVLSPFVVEVCAELSRKLTADAPSFVKDVCEVVVEPLPIPMWRAAGARVRLAVRRLDEDAPYPLTSAGTGMARYVLLAVGFALERAHVRSYPSAGKTVGQTLYVIDEPERHLHPLAQTDAAAWLSDRARSGAELCIATHSPAFLDLPTENVGYYGVVRSEGSTTADEVGPDLLSALRDRGSAYGMSPGEILLLTRAILLVEGEHDELVLEHCYGDLLREQRIIVVPIRGTDNAPGLAETEFLARVNRRLIVLFDGTLRVKLEAARRAGKLVDRMSKEERAAIELVLGIEGRAGPQVDVVPLDVQDILAAFPEATMSAAVGELGGTFPGWTSVLERYRRAPAENFKTFLSRDSGIPTVSSRKLLDAALQLTPANHPLPGPLHHAVQEVVKLSRRRGLRQPET